MAAPKYLTKRQIIQKVNQEFNLPKKLKPGSWDYFAPRAGVFTVCDEPVPGRNMRRDLYPIDSVKKMGEYLRSKISPRVA